MSHPVLGNPSTIKRRLQLGVIVNLDLFLTARSWIGYVELHTGPNEPGPSTTEKQASKGLNKALYAV